MPDNVTPDLHVAIIGAGFGGIAAAIRLAESGIRDFAILEKGDQAGGTWLVNNYPGIAVDVPSFSYQLSSDLNPGWSRVFAPGAEIRDYTMRVIERHRLGLHIRYGHRVERLRYDESNDLWELTIGEERLRARYVINATGGLSEPKLPDIPGLEDFGGKIMHTARWDHSLNLRGKRVAVIGTGASAVQVVPAIAEEVKQLSVFQRTPIWVLPKPDASLENLKPILRRLPVLEKLARFACTAAIEFTMFGVSYNRQVPQLTRAIEALGRRWIRRQVSDSSLQKALTPSYGFGCKRPSLSNDYLRTFNRSNTELVVDPIERITCDGIRTADGVEHKFHAIILATGYLTTEPGNLPPMPVAGVNGVDLGEFWLNERFQAYEGVTVPGFPNYFLTFGPYAVAGLSILAALENGARHATRVILEADRRGVTRVEISRRAHDSFFAHVLRAQRNSIFFNNGCVGSNSYYFDAHGDAPLLRPGGQFSAWWRSGHFDLGDYDFTRTTSPAIEKRRTVSAGVK